MADTGLIAFLVLVAAPATNSGLIVFLPLVGAILGGIIGAFGGAWANSWYRDREAKKAEIRELEALMHLISAEIVVNAAIFRRRNRRAGIAEHLSVAVWEESRIRLTQMLPAEDFGKLVIYYATIKYVRDHWKGISDDGLVGGKWHPTDEEHRNNAESLGGEILRTVSNKYSDMTQFIKKVEEAARVQVLGGK